MDQEIKKILDVYLSQIENREADIVLLKKEIGKILNDAKREKDLVLSGLENKFQKNQITEEYYLKKMREENAKILQSTKDKLNMLVQEIEGMCEQHKQADQTNKDKINKLRKQLGLSDSK